MSSSPLCGRRSWDLALAHDVVVPCDSDKIQRLFDNLLRNAVNYSYPKSCIRVSLETGLTQVEVCVQNQGQTIPQDKLDRIFEQFYRLDTARSSSSGGAGLGLAIAKEIVELHGGTIRAESTDQRVSFRVTLPLTRPETR